MLFYRVIYISCKANSISVKCQGRVKEGQGHESNDVLPNDDFSRSERHLLERWRLWDNFLREVTHLFFLIRDTGEDPILRIESFPIIKLRRFFQEIKLIIKHLIYNYTPTFHQIEFQYLCSCIIQCPAFQINT